jgi:DNA primase
VPRHPDTSLAAIKRAIDIVSLMGDYLTLHRSGTKFKALCPFHDDHNPSLVIDPERQSYKCWPCGAGGDIFDFIQAYERVEFPEALRMLAERAGVTLDSPTQGSASHGPSKTELFAATAWAERQFAEALARSPEARSYVQERGISEASVARFGLGYAPEARDWLVGRARRDGISPSALEGAGLIVRDPETRTARLRFRGRLIFPIHDLRGRTLGFGGRILPSAEERLAESGRNVAKYLNSPETALFQKRKVLYAADLARASARQAGWVAVVEGYTDVIAAHQAGLTNVVGTLGTALGEDHVQQLRRLADRVVLVFDGDEAGQRAADKALELFLGHEVDLRVLTLPEGLDPCDFVLAEGADAFRARLEAAADPLEFAVGRAADRFDLGSAEGARQAAEWVLGTLARIPRQNRIGMDIKVDKALDTLSRHLGVSVEDLRRRLKQLRRPTKGVRRAGGEPQAGADVSNSVPIAIADLDRTDLELVRVALNEPSAVGRLVTRVAVDALRDAPLRAILQACYDEYAESTSVSFDRVMSRLDDPAVRSLAAGLLLPIEPAPLSESARPAPWGVRLAGALAAFDERERQGRLRELKTALGQTDKARDPQGYGVLLTEYLRLLNWRPEEKNAS